MTYLVINEKILIHKLHNIKKDIMQEKKWKKKVFDEDGFSHFLDLLIEYVNGPVCRKTDYCVICGKQIEDYTYVEFDKMVCSAKCSDEVDELWRGK